MTPQEKLNIYNQYGKEKINTIHPGITYENGKLTIQFQVGHPSEKDSISGCFGTHAIQSLIALHKLYMTLLPCKETEQTILKLEEAYLWLKMREFDRADRQVLQTDKK